MQGCSSTAGEVMAAMTKLPQTPRNNKQVFFFLAQQLGKGICF